MKHVAGKAVLGSLVAACCVAALPAAAQGVRMNQSAQMSTSLYLGGNVGMSHFRNSCEGVPVSCDDKDNAWKVFAGYRFHRSFALEAGYANLGKVTASGPFGGAAVSAEGKVRGFELVGVLFLPVHPQFDLYGKLGAIRSTVDVSITGAVPGFTATQSVKDRSTDLTYGFGAQYNFTPNLGGRLEWQRYQGVGGGNTGKENIDVFSVGALYSF